MEKAAFARAPSQKKGSTPFRGVRLIKSSGRYGAELTVPGEKRRVWLGTFDTPEEAAREYDRAARSYGCSEYKMNFRKGVAPTRKPPESSSEVADRAGRETLQIDLNFPPPLD